MQTLAEFLQNNPLTLEAERVPQNPNMPDSDMFHWQVTIKNGDKALKTFYSMGFGHVEDRNGERVHNWHWKPKHNSFVPYKFGGRLKISDTKDGKMRGYRPARPQLGEVLDCLASDASGYDNSRNFEDWASEYGYDTDSRKAYASYQTIAEQAKELKHFLGDDAYNALLWDTERE